jgi:hypothetical protein
LKNKAGCKKPALFIDYQTKKSSRFFARGFFVGSYSAFKAACAAARRAIGTLKGEQDT